MTFKDVQAKKFFDYKVSTKTFIANTNLVLDISAVFETLPITSYVLVQKKRGRKKKQPEENPNKDIPNGSVISVKNEGKIRGVDLKGKIGKEFFRNSMSVDMYIENKMINYKVSRNGKFQITGCKEDSQAEQCVNYFWSYIKDHKNCYSLDPKFAGGASGDLLVLYEPAMYNIDFSLGFQVNRENLDNYVNTSTVYNSLLETTFGYTGVNIKLPKTAPNNLLKVKCVSGEEVTWMPYEEFLDKFKNAKQRAKQNSRLNTFLVFQSGKVIMSGQTDVFMEDTYYKFISIINDCYELITEKLTN